MNYCSECGHTVTLKIPEDDHRPRYVCDRCNTIHYQNPRLITGTLPVAPDGRVLLCKRNIEPRKNYWTLPAGFMENGESTIEGALRETYEESRVKAINPTLLSVISLPSWDQVHLFYLVDMPDFQFATTPESCEVALFTEADIPWSDIAFKTVGRTLRHYFASSRDSLTVLNDHIHLTSME
ncbi:MAG: NUDIX hydrolase [Reinekea sp.]|nr:NUDIX hydrolase [Reinekea sp.]